MKLCYVKSCYEGKWLRTGNRENALQFPFSGTHRLPVFCLLTSEIWRSWEKINTYLKWAACCCAWVNSTQVYQRNESKCVGAAFASASVCLSGIESSSVSLCAAFANLLWLTEGSKLLWVLVSSLLDWCTQGVLSHHWIQSPRLSTTAQKTQPWCP